MNRQLTKTVLQECNGCGHTFNVEYCIDGHYNYIDEPCDCECGFSPVNGEPSFSEWSECTS